MLILSTLGLLNLSAQAAPPVGKPGQALALGATIDDGFFQRPFQTQTLSCGLWRVDGSFVSTIHIKNSLLIGPIEVSPIIYMADGTEYDLPSVTIATAGTATVNINESLKNAAHLIGNHVSQFGSAALRYEYPAPGEVSGSMGILNITKSLSFEYPFTPTHGNTGFAASTWVSSNTAMATIQTRGQTSPGMMHGAQGGSLNIEASSFERLAGCVQLGDPCNSDTLVADVPTNIQVPTSVAVIATLSTSPTCPLSGFKGGFTRNVVDQLLDQFGQAYAKAGINMADKIQVGSRNDLGFNRTPVTGSTKTDSQGGWNDKYFTCSNVCPGSTGESDALQSWTYNGLGLPHVNQVIYKCSSVTVDGK